MKARVWNIRDTSRPADIFYIGRPGRGKRGKWGNPFPLDRPLTQEEADKIEERLPLLAEIGYASAGSTLTREQAIELHRAYLIWALRNERLDVRELTRSTDTGLVPADLVCFCAPDECHGDTLLELAESYCFYRNERGLPHGRALADAMYIVQGTTI